MRCGRGVDGGGGKRRAGLSALPVSVAYIAHTSVFLNNPLKSNETFYVPKATEEAPAGLEHYFLLVLGLNLLIKTSSLFSRTLSRRHSNGSCR